MFNTSSTARHIAAPYTSPRDVIKVEDGFLAYYFSARVANRIVWFTFRYLPRITPNLFTTASLILGFCVAYLFSRSDYSSLVAGVILLHISFIFDCCDGQLARLMGMKSQFGAWSDYHSDKLKDGFILVGFAWGAFVASGREDAWILVVAFLGIFFQFLRNICALNRDIFTLETIGKKDKSRTLISSDKGNQLIRTLKHSSLFKLSDRVLLFTIFGLANYAVGGIVIYAALTFFFSSASGYLNYNVFKKYDTQKTI